MAESCSTKNSFSLNELLLLRVNLLPWGRTAGQTEGPEGSAATDCACADITQTPCCRGTGVNSFFARNHGWHRTTRVAAWCTARRFSEHGRRVWNENPSGLNKKKERNRRRRQWRKWQIRWFTNGRWLATISGDVSVFSGLTVACAVAHAVRFIFCLGLLDLCICEMYNYLFWGHCCLNCMVGTSRSSCSPACTLLHAAFSWGLNEMQTLRNYHPYQQVIQGSGLTLAMTGLYQTIFVSRLFNSFSQSFSFLLEDRWRWVILWLDSAPSPKPFWSCRSRE